MIVDRETLEVKDRSSDGYPSRIYSSITKVGLESPDRTKGWGAYSSRKFFWMCKVTGIQPERRSFI